MKRTIKIYLMGLFLSLFMLPAFAQDTGDLNARIPLDPEIRKGKLENGLTYYIKRNEKPEDKVELRLAVNAGSVLETDEQLGLAHFLEHMAFNGTKNFEKNELVSYLQSVGVKFGMHLNAYTSFDETVYILPIPSDSAEILNQGLQILEDWAHNISLREEDIDKERGVVLEEWRIGRGPDQRMMEVYLPVIFKNSRYAERLPIGEKAIIESFEYETIRNFYRDWYRPDLMAIIAVGDINVDEMEKKIKEQFSRIPPAENPKPRRQYDIPDHEETLVSIVRDKEAPFTAVRLYYKTDKAEEEKLKNYRQMLVRQLYSNIINQRLSELQQKADPPFLYGYTYYGNLLARAKDAYQSIAAAPEDGIARALQTLVEENERVKRFGFMPGELERAKREMLSNYEQAYNEKDKTESQSYANEYLRNFLQGEPIPGIEFEYNFVEEHLPGIELNELNDLAEEWITEENRVVVITAPEKEGVVLPTEEEVKAILDQVENKDLAPYEDKLTSTTLMTDMPEPGAVASTKKIDAIGVTEMTLSNGVKVILKPTDFKNDEILMNAYSPGGSSVYSLEDYYSARNASDIVQQSGVKDFSSTDLQKILAGKNASVSPFISSLTEGFSGKSTPKDFETMLQLTHLYFTDPRKDQESFQSFIAKNKALYKNLLSNPRYYYSDTVQRVFSRNHPRGGGFPTEEDWNKIDFDKTFEVYHDRFANAGDFTFLFVGNFVIDSIRPMLEQYLGSLPSTGREEKWQDVGIRPPEGPLKEKVYKGAEPQSIVVMRFETEAPYDRKEAYYFNAFAEALDIKLIEILREEKGGVYSAGANASAEEYPYEHYSFSISFPCAPENVDDLVQTALDLIKDLRENGPSEEDLHKIKETQRRIRQENLKNNNYWLNALKSYYYHNEDPKKIMDYEERVDKLTASDIKKVANRYLDPDKYVMVILYPEEFQQ